MIPAFSAAIFVSVSPSTATWSIPIGVITDTSGVSTFVESSLPPSPTSITITSTRTSAKYRNAIAVWNSNTLTVPEPPRSLTDSAAGQTRSNIATNRSCEIGTPSTVKRSVMVCRCGEMNIPVRMPHAERAAAIMAQVLPLPLLPAT